MSGLETAIRNALERSDRADREIRSRIYQSARQALDAGLRKQGVSDRLIIMQQHELLERKIHEIEMEEQRRVVAPLAEPIEVEVDGDLAYAPEPAAPKPQSVEAPEPVAAPQPVAREPQFSVDSDMRAAPAAPREAPPVANPSVASPSAPVIQAAAAEVAPDVRPTPVQPQRQDAGNLGDVAVDRSEHVEFDRAEPKVKGKQPKPAKVKKGKAAASADTGLNVPPERAAKPRKRRGFLSHLLTWVITLAVVGAGCWWFYQSGMVQSFIEEAERAADQPGGLFSQGSSAGFDPRRGFSDEWREIFAPSKAAAMKPGPQARAETVAASEGQAVRILSTTPGEGGDVSIEVPADVLREMAGKSSTVALTLQSGGNNLVQLAVRCDFGSLGSCSRHRFTATQEKLEALFRVTFDRSLAPNRPGRLILNSGIDGPDRSVLVYSVRILPGQ